MRRQRVRRPVPVRHAGVPAGKLFIYGGGMTEWEAAALPVESGPRDSGSIRNPGP